jgi:carbon storage regulator
MLVLKRRKDESIMIGDDVKVTVVRIRGDWVQLGIAAPDTIRVHRQEVYDLIRSQEIKDVCQRDLP